MLSSAKVKLMLVDRHSYNGYLLVGATQMIKEGQGGYDVVLSQTQLSTNNPHIKCENYEMGKTLIDCVDRTSVENFKFVGCVPPWYTDNQKHICKNDNKTGKLIKENLINYTNTLIEPLLNSYIRICQKPCKSVSVRMEDKYNYELPDMFGDIKIASLNFDKTVSVTRSIRKIQGLTVMNDIGSSMGLWLGMSVFTIFQMGTRFGVNLISSTEPKCLLTRLKIKEFVGVASIVVVTIGSFMFLALFIYFWYLSESGN